MEILFYLFQVNCALIAFYGIYYFLLRKLTFYTLNRYFMLFTMCFSFLYPLVDWKGWLQGFRAAEGGIPMDLNQISITAPASFDFASYIQGVFFCVLAFLSLRFLIRLFSLFMLHRESKPATWKFFPYRHVFRKISPFSFWRNIYIHSQSHPDHEMQDILHHEQVHVHELHTIDILLSELNSMINWFNPFAWLFKKAVQENLEFLTDQRVIQSGVDKKLYQMSLLQVQKLVPETQLGNSFNIQYLKRRIQMMNKKRSSSLHLMNYLVSIPSVVLFVLIFTVSKAYHDPKVHQLIKSIQSDPVDRMALSIDPANIPLESEKPQEAYVKAKPIVSNISTENQEVTHDVSSSNLQNSENVPSIAIPAAFVGTIPLPEKLDKDYQITFRYISKASLGDEGTAPEIRVEKGDIDVSRVKIVRGYGVKTKITKESDDTPVYTQTHRFEVRDSDAFKITVDQVDQGKQAIAPYILVDGVELLHGISSLEPNEIERILVYKGEEAVKMHGDRAKNGLVLISTKKSK